MSRGLKTISTDCNLCTQKDAKIKDLEYKLKLVSKVLYSLENMILLGLDINKIELGIRIRRSEWKDKKNDNL